MKTIAIEDIHVAPNRQRRVFDAAKLHEFADGIAKRGLFHPIVLRLVNDQYVLVAGERRLRAVSDLHGLGFQLVHDGQVFSSGTIPYTLFDDLDPLAAEEAELEENIHREDLTWQERAAAHARLDALRSAQAVARGEALPTVASIALEVRGSSAGVNQETTRRELIVAKHLDKPAVAAAKTVDEAFKILKREEAATRSKELGISVGRTFTAEMHTALNEDSLAWMGKCPPNQFDCILTDPPYGMDADEFGDSGGRADGGHAYDDSIENFYDLMNVLCRESYRLAKEQAHLYCFCDIDQFGVLRGGFADAGWQVFRTPLIWYKKTGMRAPWPEHGPQRKYETLLYAIKGKRPTLKLAPDVIECPSDNNLGHQAQKPVALFEELLRRTCLPGNTILDPFMGSGTIFAAAHSLKCRATGIELDPTSYGIAVKRIQLLKKLDELHPELGL